MDIAKLSQCLGQTGPQSVDVRAALGGGNQVDVGLLNQFTFGSPDQGPF